MRKTAIVFNKNKSDFIFQNSGQALVDYLMLVALIVAMLIFVIQMFTPQKASLVGALRINLTNVISNGSMVENHPLEDKRVITLK
jgi:hypothetical protein